MAQHGGDDATQGKGCRPESDPHGDHGFADGNQDDEPVPLYEMCRPDPKATNAGQVRRGRPVKEEAGSKQGQSHPSRREAGAEEQRRRDQVEGAQPGYRLDHALL
jgi:hypothetical protein